jgi:hypothetical protein
VGEAVPVGVLLVVDQHLLVVETLLLLLPTPLRLLLPLVLLALEPLLQTRVIEIVQFLTIVVALNAIVGLVVLVESLLLWVGGAVPVTLREDCLGGL